MWMLLLGLLSGLLASSRSQSTTAVSARSCSYVGVFHVAGRERYSLTFEMAKRLCEDLSTSLANMTQVEEAYKEGLQTCRYGWVDSQVPVVLRHRAKPLCGGNQTGVIKILNGTKYDAFCYNAKDLSVKNCTAEIHPDSLKEEDANPVTALTVSTPVHWTQTSATQSPVKHNETDQTHDTDQPEGKGSTTLQPHTGMAVGERTSTHETTANKTGDVTQNNSSSGSDTTRSSDFLIILLTILPVLLILLICVIVATRKRCCGNKNKKTVTQKSTSKENGASASFAQEPESVTLVN
ncbi:uncharacterized protein LOC143752291 [Siphateles boraxobius]|uniref:uncharacterized protein LOC143752291 n=1 Tax=Siphateles boraxobius TaxID=180520 RepID=UPI004064618A